MPLWKDGSLFDSSSKNASNDEPQPSSDARKKDDEGVNKESGIDDQERPENSTQDVNTAGPSINTASTNVNTGSLNINTVSPTVTTAPLEATHADFFGDETKIDMSNITTTYLVPSTPNTRIHKDHSLDHVIGDVQSGVQTRRMTKTTNEQGRAQKGNPSIKRSNLDRSYAKRAFAVQVITEGYTQEEGIDYDEVFALVARIEAIRLFLAYALFKDFVVYQMDVKSAFFYGKIEEEVYVCQPPGFEDPEFPDRVYKIDKTLFIKRVKNDNLLVQVYVDDIIFGSTKKELCTEFEKLMHKKFQMSSMGELTFLLGLQVTQTDDGIFISQDKYVDEILKKFGFSTVKTASTPMETSKPLMKDENAEDIDVHLYRSMIGSLMYLTSSRLDIMFVVCACVRFQVTPKVSHFHAVKRIFRYFKGQKTGESSELAEESRVKEADELRFTLKALGSTGRSSELEIILRVHHVSTEKGIDIYMLVEKEYPLSRGTLTLMLVAKLLVDQDNEMSRELLRKIFMQVTTSKGNENDTASAQEDKMSRNVIMIGSTTRIPLLYQSEYSEWRGRFMNYLKEQTYGEVMIHSITHGEQPLPIVTQVSLAETTLNALLVLKDPKLFTAEEKQIQKIDHLARYLLI
ncbi:putative ribonuclease H-like domain-containing protein [Tanacetum coccineum]